MAGKYESKRDEALHTLATQEWANESGGDVEAPTGYFWRLTLTPDELEEAVQAFTEYPRETLQDCIGAWIIVEDSQGFVTCTDWATNEQARTFDARARVRFAGLEREYLAWADSE